MSKIDFYLLQTLDHLSFACRLIEKAYKNKHQIYIHTDTEKDAHTIDELLWTYRDDSFLPHNLIGEGPDLAPPIQIGWGKTPEKHRDVLLNLSQIVPDFFKQFSRVLELVSQEATMQQFARDRYRIYQQQNYKITTHKV
jgi:DNA polymerase-3 subunit chi